MDKNSSIYLIRHAETAWTVSKKHTGLTDIPLTDNGIRQSQALAKRLKQVLFTAIFTSPLIRAKQTCEIAGLITAASIEPLLLEWNYGDYEGLTSEEIHQIDPNWSIFSKGAPNGETPQQISERADQVLHKINFAAGNIAIFSSGHFLRVLAARWLGYPAPYGKSLALFPASVSILGFERTTPVLKSWNETFFYEG